MEDCLSLLSSVESSFVKCWISTISIMGAQRSVNTNMGILRTWGIENMRSDDEEYPSPPWGVMEAFVFERGIVAIWVVKSSYEFESSNLWELTFSPDLRIMIVWNIVPRGDLYPERDQLEVSLQHEMKVRIAISLNMEFHVVSKIFVRDWGWANSLIAIRKDRPFGSVDGFVWRVCVWSWDT